MRLQLHVRLYSLLMQILKFSILVATVVDYTHMTEALRFIFSLASEPDIDEIASKAESMFAGR